MALTAGTVSVSGGGVVSGSGLARTLYDAKAAATQLYSFRSSTSHPYDDVETKQALAVEANATAAAVLAWLNAGGYT